MTETEKLRLRLEYDQCAAKRVAELYAQFCEAAGLPRGAIRPRKKVECKVIEQKQLPKPEKVR